MCRVLRGETLEEATAPAGPDEVRTELERVGADQAVGEESKRLKAKPPAVPGPEEESMRRAGTGGPRTGHEARGESSPATGQRCSERGHRAVPHTADMRVQAWSPTAEGCIGEAVRAVVEGFVDTSTARPVAERAYRAIAATDEDLLVSVLEEVIYRMDADGEIPIDASVGAIRDVGDGRGVSVRFRMADSGTAELVGAVPKAVALHGLHLHGGPGGWTCQVTLDV